MSSNTVVDADSTKTVVSAPVVTAQKSEPVFSVKTEPVSVAGVSQAPTILSWPPATGVTGVNGVNQFTPTFQVQVGNPTYLRF